MGLSNVAPAELDPAFYGLTDADMDKEFLLPMSTFIGGNKKSLKLKDIISRLKVLSALAVYTAAGTNYLKHLTFFSGLNYVFQTIYCSHTGIEYMHLTNFEQLEWVRKRFEEPSASKLTHEQKKTLFKRLIRSTKFEEFLAKKVAK